MNEPIYQLDCVCDSPRCRRAALIYSDQIAVKVGKKTYNVIIPESVVRVIVDALDKMSGISEHP